MFDWIVPFMSPTKSIAYILYNFVWILAFGALTALVVFGIPRVSFMFFQKWKNKRDIEDLMDDMEEDENEAETEL